MRFGFGGGKWGALGTDLSIDDSGKVKITTTFGLGEGAQAKVDSKGGAGVSFSLVADGIFEVVEGS